MRALRILRAIRVLRLLKAFKYLEGLRRIAEVLINSFSSFFAIVILLVSAGKVPGRYEEGVKSQL